MPSGASEQLTDAVRRLGRRRADQQAWETLFNTSWSTALATTHRILGGQLELAADAAQEAFTRIVRYCDFQRIADGPAFLAYLQKVCRHAALDLRRRMMSTSAGQPLDPASGRPRDIPRQPFAPEQSLRRDELRRELVRHLDSDEQQLLGMLLEERSLTEIAARCGISYANAGVRVHRLRAKLRKRLEDE
jgi:RNA polymerase sigma factor (sigma-70 family)